MFIVEHVYTISVQQILIAVNRTAVHFLIKFYCTPKTALTGSPLIIKKCSKNEPCDNLYSPKHVGIDSFT